MKTIMAFIKRHPVLSYFALTFAISWGGMLVVIGGPCDIRGTEEQVEMLWPLALLATFAGPPIASILLTGLVAGRAGLLKSGACSFSIHHRGTQTQSLYIKPSVPLCLKWFKSQTVK